MSQIIIKPAEASLAPHGIRQSRNVGREEHKPEQLRSAEPGNSVSPPSRRVKVCAKGRAGSNGRSASKRHGLLERFTVLAVPDAPVDGKNVGGDNVYRSAQCPSGCCLWRCRRDDFSNALFCLPACSSFSPVRLDEPRQCVPLDKLEDCADVPQRNANQVVEVLLGDVAASQRGYTHDQLVQLAMGKPVEKRMQRYGELRTTYETMDVQHISARPFLQPRSSRRIEMCPEIPTLMVLRVRLPAPAMKRGQSEGVTKSCIPRSLVRHVCSSIYRDIHLLDHSRQ